FSSRRRHTRFSRDWSSDVCSSDLFNLPTDQLFGIHSVVIIVGFFGLTALSFEQAFIQVIGSLLGFIGLSVLLTMIQSRMRVNPRSEERRVGKGCRSRWSRYELRE